jgi:tyrosyl-tRNA synthetase
MSKSKPSTCIFIYDSPKEIKQKMQKAFCPERTIEFNPIIDICKYIIFREKKILTISRPTKFGGNIEFHNFSELSSAFLKGSLHPQDLKNAVASQLADILEPVRRYFINNKEAQKCLNIIRDAKITR